MKIAVTYDNGNIFQHFGKTETFKVYEVEDDKVVSSEVIGSNGEGHGALAGLLAGQNVDVLICGGIGGGAQTALAEAGVELCSGAQGDADQAVEAYLKGELVSRGATCDHHHHEGRTFLWKQLRWRMRITHYNGRKECWKEMPYTLQRNIQ